MAFRNASVRGWRAWHAGLTESSAHPAHPERAAPGGQRPPPTRDRPRQGSETSSPIVRTKWFYSLKVCGDFLLHTNTYTSITVGLLSAMLQYPVSAGSIQHTETFQLFLHPKSSQLKILQRILGKHLHKQNH